MSPTQVKKLEEKINRLEKLVVTHIKQEPDFEDYLELHNPKARQHLEKSYKEYLAGKLIPGEQVLAEMRKKYPVKYST
ncbi:hypothetical protein HYZ64_01730 [Candidatus Berkelbacteria bacterium]|nr:hypothetical protein [Candidatus Berkelbacteria bacterium]